VLVVSVRSIPQKEDISKERYFYLLNGIKTTFRIKVIKLIGAFGGVK